MIDLHLHTTMSDGRHTPAALVRLCAAAGVRVFSVTDHDTTGGWAEAAAEAAENGLEFVPGVEVTAVAEGRDVHVLGYFPATRVPLVESFLREQRADRLRRVRQIVRRLGELALPVNVDRALHEAEQNERRTVGRPQIADAMIAAGHVASRDEAFQRYLGHGRPAYVPRTGATPHEVIELITAAGGLASLAHPGLLERDEIILALVLAGLHALEVFHSDHDADTRARYGRLASASRLLVTGGSDFHGETAGHHGCTLGHVGLPPEQWERFRNRLFE